MDLRGWRERRLYPIIGGLILIFLLYVSFFGDDLAFPSVVWQPKMGFVATDTTHFVIVNGDGQDRESNPPYFYVNGWNSYWLLQESIWSSSRPRVSNVLKAGAELGLTVCRTWAFSDGDGPNTLQLSPGVFNERVFRGLDYVIVEARRHGIRLILSLVNNLDAFGGKDQYVRWGQQAGINVSSSDDSFFANPAIKDYYKAYIKKIVTRKNSLSRVKYSDEPAIFAWELMNEPRCASSTKAWISEMTSYLKSLDRKHLVTVGLEGFYGLNTTNKSEVNPGEWAASLGSDFIENSAVHDIDFASVHSYPDSWMQNADLETKAKYLTRWVDSHIGDGDSLLKKPVLFTEVGSVGGNDRDVLLKIVYDKIYESAKKKEAGGGALIWQLLVDGVEQYSDRFSFVPEHYPTTAKLIKDQSCRLLHNVSGEAEGKPLNPKDVCFGHH
ncbi:Mannan endo-1,4-beta-mannosidase 6 [Linum grandiflorum]